MYIHICVCACVLCVCICSNILIQDYVYTVPNTRILLGKIADLHTYMNIYIYIYILTYVYVCVCVCWCFCMCSNILVKDFLDAVPDTQILLGEIADVHTYIYVY